MGVTIAGNRGAVATEPDDANEGQRGSPGEDAMAGNTGTTGSDTSGVVTAGPSIKNTGAVPPWTTIGPRGAMALSTRRAKGKWTRRYAWLGSGAKAQPGVRKDSEHCGDVQPGTDASKHG